MRWIRAYGSLTRVLAAWLLVGAGGWAFMIALAVYAYDKSGAGAVGAVTAARLLPAMFAAPVAGGLVDRANRGRVVAVACLVQAACLATATWLIAIHGSLVVIAVLAAGLGAAATAPRPGLEALLPALAATSEQLTRAVAAWSAVDSGAFLLGGGIGGAAIAAVGSGTVVAASAGALALAAALAVGLPVVTATAPDETPEETGLSSLLAGIRTVVELPLLRVPFALFAGLLLLEGTTDVQLVALALGKLHMGSGGPGILYAVWGLSGVLGSVAILAVVRRRGYGLALGAGAAVFGIGVALSGAGGTALAIGMMIPAGVGFALAETAVMALVPRLADDAIVGRVYGVLEVAYAGAAASGALIAPVLIGALGAAGSLAAVGIVFCAGALLAWRTYAAIDGGQEEATHVRGLLRGITFLAPLPLPRLERLVRAARPVTVPAEAVVIRAGEPGDAFFVIDEGTVEVVEPGREQGPGSGFGEIALLRDVPRTATVRAATDLKLWSLSRSSFIAAVSSQGDASRLADAVIAGHLQRPARAAAISPDPGQRP